MSPARTRTRSALRILAIGAVYAAGAWLAGALTLPPNNLTSVRPPNALILAAALFAPPETWWLYPFATIPANPSLFHPGVSWGHALGYAAANLVEVAVAVGVLWLALRRAPRFNRLTDCAVFVIGAAGVAPAVGAAIGAAVVDSQNAAWGFWPTWRIWMLGDALSMIVLVPAIVLCARVGWRRRPRRVEATVVLAAIVAVTVPSLAGMFGDISRFPALMFAPLPLLVWAAVRLGVVEHALGVVVLSGVVLAVAASRAGAFEGLSSSDAALSMQLLLLMIAVPLMFLAAIIDERRQGEARFMTLFRATPDIIVITTLKDGRIIEVNESFERVTGLTRGHAVGRTMVELGLVGGTGERGELVDRITADGRVRDYPMTLTGADGSLRHVLLSADRVELNGEDALIAVRRDVTERVLADAQNAQMESQLEQARKMEAIGRLAGGIAHDFNNLLQAIRGYTEVAAQRLPADHTAQPPLQQVIRAADQAATLTNQLLTFSRREAITRQAVDVNALVGDLVRILRRLIGEHIDLQVNGAPGLPPMLADRNQVEQVVMNLCLNARDAMPAGGRVMIRTGHARFDADDCRDLPWAREGDWVWLRVADQGSGIPPDVLPRIFEPFFTTKGTDRGTGLGLATVYAIVERHGGLLTVDTEPGAGTTFTIYFPMATEVAEAVVDRQAPEPPRVSGREEVILLAEDDPFVRELAVEFLESAAYRVLVACDGEEADEFVRGPKRIDLALLDVAMPRRNGREVYETIREARPGLPVIFTSGYAFGELEDLHPEAGSILPKPYSRAVLLQTIRAAIDQRRSATQ